MTPHSIKRKLCSLNGSMTLQSKVDKSWRKSASRIRTGWGWRPGHETLLCLVIRESLLKTFNFTLKYRSALLVKLGAGAGRKTILSQKSWPFERLHLESQEISTRNFLSFESSRIQIFYRWLVHATHRNISLRSASICREVISLSWFQNDI